MALPEGVVSVWCFPRGAVVLYVPHWAYSRLPPGKNRHVNVYYDRELKVGVFHFVGGGDADDGSYHVNQNRVVISGLCRVLGLRLRPGRHYFRASHDDDVLIVFFDEPARLGAP